VARRSPSHAPPAKDAPPPAGGGAELWVPRDASLAELRAASRDCRGCELWRSATQTVFGEGSARSSLLLVGEQPGDAEDRAGRPFVGPAGRLLDEALAAAGIDRKRVFVTNAVKHFKWEPRGKLRIHAKPSAREIAACRPWLRAEIEAVRPKVVLALGATAARSVIGPGFRVTRERGRLTSSPLGTRVIATVHPASILRAPDPQSRRLAMEAFVADLRVAAKVLAEDDDS
jgi:uracil-DNA glycosylase